jgi:hypothetical protein
MDSASSSFQQLKQELSTTPIMQLLDFDKSFIMTSPISIFPVSLSSSKMLKDTLGLARRRRIVMPHQAGL